MGQRSHITQILQNYLDATDVRSRGNPTSIEAQMLNMAGIELEDLLLRVDREISQAIQDVPTNIDNGGVYNSTSLPNTVTLQVGQTTLNNVVITSGDDTRTLVPFDDRLATPTRVDLDTDNVVELDSPLIFTVVGVGDDTVQSYPVQYVSPGAFPIPNILTLWVDELGLHEVNVKLTITGEVYPQPAWVAERKKTTETLQITDEGIATTRNRWSTIDTIAIRNLPLGMRLRGWSMPFNLPACPDLARPFSSIDDRDVLYPRYWQVSNEESLLYEMYAAGELTGLEAVNSYALSNVINDVAVEPFANGIFAVSDSILYYADRREYYPDLSTTGLTVEPLYGLVVTYDFTKPGPTRYVTLSGTPYANSANIFQYRYVVTPSDSLNASYSILPDGSIGPANAGWRGGPPATVTFALLQNIDYEFKLEMQDGSGILTYDVVPFKNAIFTPLASIDMSAMVSGMEGVAFDSYGQLWVWTGQFAIPLNLHYDAYVLDTDSLTVFATDPFDTIEVD